MVMDELEGEVEQPKVDVNKVRVRVDAKVSERGVPPDGFRQVCVLQLFTFLNNR